MAQSPPDREDDVDAFRVDVYVLVGTTLQNPIGLCSAEPCALGETLPSAPLSNITGNLLGVTWGQFLMADADSWVSCRDGKTDVRLHLTGLIPNAVYSVFYRTFGPDSLNPFCPDLERSRVVPGPCQGPRCPNPPNSTIVTDAHGAAVYTGRVNGCLLDATTALLDVIYHANGSTYGELPNRLEFATQLRPCQTDGNCAAGDVCLDNVCQPSSCLSGVGCRVCNSSFGSDAMRQAVIIQKSP